MLLTIPATLRQTHQEYIIYLPGIPFLIFRQITGIAEQPHVQIVFIIATCRSDVGKWHIKSSGDAKLSDYELRLDRVTTKEISKSELEIVGTETRIFKPLKELIPSVKFITIDLDTFGIVLPPPKRQPKKKMKKCTLCHGTGEIPVE